MNGYFSRLMEQSGIPAAGPASALPARPPAGMDLEVLVEPRGGEPIFEPRKGPEAASEIPGRTVEEPVHDPVERVLHRETPEPPHRRPEDRRQSGTRAPALRASERTPPRRGADLPARVDVVEGRKVVDQPVDSFREVLEQDEPVEASTRRVDERSLSDVGASEEAPAFEPREEPRDRGGRERVWQSTFEEVREWVAESPVADEGGAEDVSQARAATSVAALFVEERVAATRPGPVVTPPREEPQTQDLRLEIGTISVTVEEPRGEIPGTNRRPEVPQRKLAGGERSRLSRHYVRVR